MAFVTRKIPVVVLAAVTSLGLLAPHAAEARNGQNAALIAGALLGLTAGSALAQSARDNDRYVDEEPPPRPIYRRRFVEPAYDEAGYDDPYRPTYRDDGPRYRLANDGWDRGPDAFVRGERGFDRPPCPDHHWRRYGYGW